MSPFHRFHILIFHEKRQPFWAYVFKPVSCKDAFALKRKENYIINENADSREDYLEKLKGYYRPPWRQ